MRPHVQPSAGVSLRRGGGAGMTHDLSWLPSKELYWTARDVLSTDLASFASVRDRSGHSRTGVVSATAPRMMGRRWSFRGHPSIRFKRAGSTYVRCDDVAGLKFTTDGSAFTIVHVFQEVTIDTSYALFGNHDGVFGAKNGITVERQNDESFRFVYISAAGGGTVRLARSSTAHRFPVGTPLAIVWRSDGAGNYAITIASQSDTETLTGAYAGAADSGNPTHEWRVGAYGQGGSGYSSQDVVEHMICSADIGTTRLAALLAQVWADYGITLLGYSSGALAITPRTGTLKVYWRGDSRPRGDNGTEDPEATRGVARAGTYGWTYQAVGPVALPGSAHACYGGSTSRSVDAVSGHSPRASNSISIDNDFGPGKSYNDSDIIVWWLGTNDLAASDYGTYDWEDELAYAIERICAYSTAPNGPHFVLLSEPKRFPLADTDITNRLVQTRNMERRALAYELQTRGYPVVVGDLYSIFDLAADTFDNVHPNDSGASKSGLLARTLLKNVTGYA